ncbi:hypothetical protein ZIOFF_017447 [Zingiber officinale]|uniref:Nuclease associated modular domain-containing protein n=1 Tax=Zingiber officinale TaxID=94328 RepID=A0A8J5HNQ0_ZINOF|nr:hypothetical protein ZIOFF_017447 [Zingiber officinale]
MASSTATLFLLPPAIYDLRQRAKPKAAPPSSALRWNPLFLSCNRLPKCRFFPPPAQDNLGIVSSCSSSSDGVAEGEEIQRQKPKSGGGVSSLSSLLEAFSAPSGPPLVAVLLGVFLIAASPCAALLSAASSFPCHLSYSSWCHTVLSSFHISSTQLENGLDNFVLSLLLMGSAAVTLVAGFFSDKPKLQVSTPDSFALALYWSFENEDKAILEESRSARTDYFASQTFFKNQGDALGISSLKGRKFVMKWNNQHAKRQILQSLSLDDIRRRFMTAVATTSPRCLIPSDCDAKIVLVSDSDAQEVQVESTNDEDEIDERERLRRARISKANKGNVPWNKGKKHSAETLRRIREGTKLAMQNPKVKMKLTTLGHAQSEETRAKIGAGVREGWRRRRQRLSVQDGCFFEWKNIIAESARKGSAGEYKLQWDSFNTQERQLKQEWLESIEKRKQMPKPKGNSRAPKSLEQRRKISEAILAKWTDQKHLVAIVSWEYRARVCSALNKYHSTSNPRERNQRKPSSTPRTSDTVPKKTTKSNSITKVNISPKQVGSKTRKNSTPSYKDPMASYKFKILKKIKEQRTAKEAKDATEKAKLLIAEAEKVAKTLEMAAPKSSLAQASLMETRMLIAEARRSIEIIEAGTLTMQEFRDEKSLDSSGKLNHFQSSSGLPNTEKLDQRPVNGFHHPISTETRPKYMNFNKLSSETAVNGWTPSMATQNTEYMEVGLTLDTESVAKGVENSNGSFISRSKKYEADPSKGDSEAPGVETSLPTSTFPVKSKKRWFHGRLVEVEEDGVTEHNRIGKNK